MIQMEIIGNLGADPERRVLEDGRVLTTFPVAITRKRKGRESVEWVKVTAYNTQAENCARYLAKGRKVYVQGDPTAYGYRNQYEEIAARIELVARSVEFLSSRDEGKPEPTPAAQASLAAYPQGFAQVDEEELPF